MSKIIYFLSVLFFLPFPVLAVEKEIESQINVHDLILYYHNFQNKFHPNIIHIDITRRDDPLSSDNHISVLLKQKNIENNDFQLAHISFDTLGETSVYAKNNKYYFNIYDEHSDKAWVIKEIDLLNDTYNTLKVLMSDLMYPISVNDSIRIEDIISMKDTKINVSIKNDQQETKSIGIEILLPENRKRRDGTLIDFNRVILSFTPEKYHWIPTDIEIFYPDGLSKIFHRDNFVMYDDLFIPTVVSWQTHLQNGKIGEQCTIKYIIDWNIKDKDVDQREFYLSYYGLPEPDFGERRTNRVRYILIGLGLLLITIGAYRLIRKRNENT